MAFPTYPEFSDFMGFVYTPDELRGKVSDAKMAEGIALGLVHLTAAPPTITTCHGIVDEVIWLSGVLTRNGARILYPYSRWDGSSAGVSKLKVVLGLQNPPTDVKSANDLRRLADLGVRITTLAYDGSNIYGGGCTTPEVHLTARGENLLRWLAEAGMMLDLSHCGHATARDIFAFVEREDLPLPVVASHSACAAIYDHPRNLPDDIMRRIVQHGGAIGIPTAPFMLSESDDSLESFLQHVAHALRITDNVNAIAIGSDGLYETVSPDEQKRQFEAKKNWIRPSYSVRYPEQPFELNTPRRMEVLFDRLESEFGYILAAKLCGENLIKFLAVRLA
jgi:microsomal dipeptidase-like Zn-dependent dipeptidase